MADVTKANFLAQLEDFLTHLPTASYVAIDEEMTGISLPGSRNRRPNKVELPGERYTRLLKGVPERYSILQVGVALFHKNPAYEKNGGGRERTHSSGGSHRGLGAGGANDPIDEHAYMHREGMLNQDELEDVTEREDEEELLSDGDDAGDGEDSDEGEEPTEYTSRIYNFYLFPNGKDGREMTLNPSTVKFLLDNNMDFDKVFKEGLPFTTVVQAEYLKKRYLEKHSEGGQDEGENGEKTKSNGTPRKNRVKLTRVEDIAFVARTMAGLREWIDSDNSAPNPLAEGAAPAAAANDDNAGDGGNGANAANGTIGNGVSNRQGEGTSLILPPCNAFLRRCLYETIEDEYPGLILERADADPNHAGVARNQIRVIRLSPAEKKRRDERMRREAWNRLLLQELGFTSVFQAISDACNGRVFSADQTKAFLDGTSSELSVSGNGRKIPLVVHNGGMDLMFLMTHCHGAELPESFEETKQVIRGYFPMVVDTKVLGTEYSDAIIRGGNTALGELFSITCNTGETTDDALALKVPPIVNQEGNNREQAHEAAWDAYMTGCVFNALCNRILEPKNRLNANLTLDGLLSDSSDSLLREWLGLNKLYMHASLYTIDLESTSGPAGLHDPLSSGLSVDTTFHVNGITTSVSTRDILQALTTGNDGEDEAIQSLKYEIIWVDDASFFVGTRIDVDVVAEDTGLIASHVRNKLHDGLGNVEILSLGDYFKRKQDLINASDAGGIVGSLVSAATKPFQVLGSVFGIGTKKRASEGESDGAANKRRRLG